MIAAFNAVLPVFLLMVLGFFLFHIRLMTGEFSAHLNRLVYWIGLPSLLFREIATQTLDWGSVSNILLAFFLALSGTILIAYAISFFQKMDESTTGSFVQAAYRGNLGFIGLPIVLYSATQATQERMQSLAALAMGPAAIAFNLIAVTVLLRHQPKTESKTPSLLFSMLTNPLIISGFLGIAAATLKIKLPSFLDRSFDELSKMAVPAALLGLGASFASFGFESLNSRNLIRNTLVCAVLKGLISPLLGLLSAILLGLDALEARIAIVYLATPTAIASFVLAGQFGSNEKLAATSIIVSTFVSIVSLPLGLWVTGDDVWQWLCQVI